ncbi:MAG: ATP-dependent DNA helicase [Microthrixaceae bacterium]
MRDKLLRGRVVVFTSATLRLGGDFTTVAQSLGFKAGEQDLAPLPRGRRPAAAASGEDPPDTEADDAPPEDVEPREYLRSHEVEQDLAVPWRAVDVGSPFAYDKQAILYIARHLPPPGRDGLGPAQLAEIVALVDASEGGVLGLFSSRRAAETAAEHVRKELPHLTTLAQGEAQLPELSRQFTQDRHASLFGTLTLWQGLDVPGDTCRLVLIDRVPFPRPDDPLMSARSRAADAAGGNGFMQVSATHAALLLAQGSGRLIRTSADRGVVAVLDPRLITARYGGFLRASLPPMWTTTDPAQALGALRRLASAGEQQSGHRGKQAQ